MRCGVFKLKITFTTVIKILKAYSEGGKTLFSAYNNYPTLFLSEFVVHTHIARSLSLSLSRFLPFYFSVIAITVEHFKQFAEKKRISVRHNLFAIIEIN